MEISKTVTAIVVEHRACAAGAIGIEAGRSAASGGLSLIVAASSCISVAPLLQKAVTYRPLVARKTFADTLFHFQFNTRLDAKPQTVL